MTYIPIIPQTPEKDETGTYRCKNCGMIISYKAFYCDKCKAKRTEEIDKFLKKYWWLIAAVLIGIILFIYLGI